MGAGKSTLDDALLCAHRQGDVARSAATGGVGTQTVVEYRQLYDDSATATECHAMIQFVTDRELRQIIINLLEVCREFSQTGDKESNEDRTEDRTRIEDTLGRCSRICGGAVDRKDLDKPEFVEIMIAAAKSRIHEAHLGLVNNRSTNTIKVQSDSIRALRTKVESDFGIRSDQSWVPDLVEHIEISMKSLSLESGIVLIDCPGNAPQASKMRHD